MELERCSIPVLICLMMLVSYSIYGKTIHVSAKNTLTVIEIDNGDEVAYELSSGRIVHLKVISSATEIIFSTISLPAKGSAGDASIFKMKCKLRIDGQEMELIRYAPVQESFYTPYTVSGLNIWFDALNSLGDFYNENHGACLPTKQIRLALHDATLPICPEEVGIWCPLPDDFPDVKMCYRGDDTWLGPYVGTDLHGGLDINMPANSPLWAPLSLDHHYYFNTVSTGANNNRWRGVKHWDNGDVWALQTHHLDQLLTDELQPLKKGVTYAYAGGTASWAWAHSHFVFTVKQPGLPDYYVDPWIIFWQMLENKKEKTQELTASFRSLPPGSTGERLIFEVADPSPGLHGTVKEFHWSFGDGTYSIGAHPYHIYQRPGIYPVTLTVFDGISFASSTQHIVINGEPTHQPELRVTEPYNISFRPRQVWETDPYNHTRVVLPNTVRFFLQHRKKDLANSKTLQVRLVNKVGEIFEGERFRIEPIYIHGHDWLHVEIGETPVSSGAINVKLTPVLSKMTAQEGEYVANLLFHSDGLVNSPTLIRVVVNFSRPSAEKTVIIDNGDPNCEWSNHVFLNTKFDRSWNNCYGDGFLVNSGTSDDGFVRYHPKVSAGRYKVSLHSPLYRDKKLLPLIGGFYVNVHSSSGRETRWVEPAKDLEIGVFDFNSCDGYVEITSQAGKGLIIADAIRLERLP